MTAAYPEVARGIRLVDVLERGAPRLTAGYFIGAPRPAIVDPGSARSVPVWLDALAALGVAAADVTDLIVTHIHLDHAGGVGHLLPLMPSARVTVHPRGARHLVDPARLVAGARDVFGPRLDAYFGAPEPVPESRVHPVADGHELDLGAGHVLRFIDAPGHARHQYMILDRGAGALFAADELGERLPDIAEDYVLADTAPNQFDPDAMLRTAARLGDLRPEAILFSHFGRYPAPYGVLQERLAREIPAVAALGRVGGRRATPAEIAAALTEHVRRDLAARGIAWTPGIQALLAERLAISAQGIADYHARLRVEDP